jgi:hypothetical protein
MGRLRTLLFPVLGKELFDGPLRFLVLDDKLADFLFVLGT